MGQMGGAIGLTQERIDTAYGDAETQRPTGLIRPTRWTTGAGAAPAESKPSNLP